MGKALIQSHIGNGQYAIKVYFDNARINQRITALQSFIAKINQDLLDLGTPKNEAYTALQSALMLLNEGIQNEASFDELMVLQKNAMETRRAYDSFIAREKRLKMRQLTSQKEITELQSKCPDFIETTAWCVSRNENLSGETKTIEIDCGVERDPSTNQIRNDSGFWIPATQNQTSPTPATDILQHPFATSVHINWLNLALLPAIQRDRGHYRIATLTSVNDDNNSCNLTFEGRYTVDRHSDNLMSDLPIHPLIEGGQQQNLTNANINYPPCNSLVFLSGDKVIVDLKNGYSTPEVIGFYSNPKRCRLWFWTDTLGIINNRPYSNGILGADPGVLRGPVATGVGTLSADVDIWPPTVLGTVRHSNYNLSVSGSTSITQTETSLGLTLTYTQTITSNTVASTEYNCNYGTTGVTHQASGSGSAGITISTSLSINGISVGVIHSLSISQDHILYGLNAKLQKRSFVMKSISYAVYDDGQIKATRTYDSEGNFTYVNEETGYIESQGSYTYSRYTSGDQRGINDTDISGEETFWPSADLAVILGDNPYYELWPSKHGEFPIVQNYTIYV